MQQLILVQPQLPEGYKAEAVSFPEISAVASSEEQAIAQVEKQLAIKLASGRLVRVEIPTPSGVNPLVKLAGRGRNDPDFDLYLEEIQRFRQEVEAKECSNSSSTPTT